MNYSLSALPNGTRVITVPMDRDSVGVAIWIQTGGRFESKKLSGISHYLEHMLFKGTRKRNTRQIKEEIEGVGGVLNAFTSEEVTCYFAKLLKGHFPRALDVLSDMVNNSTIPPEELRKERTVILEEIKMYKDLPSQYVHELMSELLWPDQPLGRSVAGTIETVSGMSRKDLMGYKKRYYHPKNILISVAGPIHHKDVMAMVRERFAQKTSNAKSKFQRAAASRKGPQTQFMEKQTEQTHLVIGLHGLSRFDKRRYSLGLMNVILGVNMSSRLFEEVREKRGLAYEIKSGLSLYQDTGAVTVSAGVESKKAAKAVSVILKELGKLRRRPVRSGELRRAKDYYKSQLSMALEDTLDHLLWVGERVIDHNELPNRDQIFHNVESVTTRDIQEISRNLFNTKELNLSLIGPISSKIKKQIIRDFEIDG